SLLRRNFLLAEHFHDEEVGYLRYARFDISWALATLRVSPMLALSLSTIPTRLPLCARPLSPQQRHHIRLGAERASSFCGSRLCSSRLSGLIVGDGARSLVLALPLFRDIAHQRSLVRMPERIALPGERL